MDITKTKRPHAEVALAGTLSAAQVEKHWAGAVSAITKEVALPGFRKGHVPEAKVIEEVGEKFLWKEAAERAVKEALEEILKKEEVVPIAPLGLSLKSGEKGEDVSFEIVVVTAPSVALGDYKATTKRALANVPQEDASKEREEAKKAFHAQTAAMARTEPSDAPLTDEEAKKLGFENAATMDLFIDGEAERAVAERSVQKRRAAVAEALLTDSPADIPNVFIREEANNLLEASKRDITDRGGKWVDYLKHIKKTEEMVLNELAAVAEKRIALDLIFGEIIKKGAVKLEGEADKKREDDLAHAVVQQGAPHDRAHAWARETMMREKVWETLGVMPESVAS